MQHCRGSCLTEFKGFFTINNPVFFAWLKRFVFNTSRALGVNYTYDFGGRYSLVSAAIVMTEVSVVYYTFSTINNTFSYISSL